MSDEAIWKAVDHYIADEPAARGPGARGGAQGQQGRWPSADRRVCRRRARCCTCWCSMWRRAQSARDRHSGRLLHDLAREGPSRRGTARQTRMHRQRAEVARGIHLRAGLDRVGEVRTGRALDVLPTSGPEAPFDLVFIDADKPGNRQYIDWALKLSRPGTVIVVDNVIREGEVIQANSANMSVQGSRAAFERLGSEKRLIATALQTVGAKGYDGFAIAIVKGRRRLIPDIRRELPPARCSSGQRPYRGSGSRRRARNSHRAQSPRRVPRRGTPCRCRLSRFQALMVSIGCLLSVKPA